MEPLKPFWLNSLASDPKKANSNMPEESSSWNLSHRRKKNLCFTSIWQYQKTQESNKTEEEDNQN